MVSTDCEQPTVGGWGSNFTEIDDLCGYRGTCYLDEVGTLNFFNSSNGVCIIRITGTPTNTNMYGVATWKNMTVDWSKSWVLSYDVNVTSLSYPDDHYDANFEGFTYKNFSSLAWPTWSRVLQHFDCYLIEFSKFATTGYKGRNYTMMQCINNYDGAIAEGLEGENANQFHHVDMYFNSTWSEIFLDGVFKLGHSHIQKLYVVSDEVYLFFYLGTNRGDTIEVQYDNISAIQLDSAVLPPSPPPPYTPYPPYPPTLPPSSEYNISVQYPFIHIKDVNYGFVKHQYSTGSCMVSAGYYENSTSFLPFWFETYTQSECLSGKYFTIPSWVNAFQGYMILGTRNDTLCSFGCTGLGQWGYTWYTVLGKSSATASQTKDWINILNPYDKLTAYCDYRINDPDIPNDGRIILANINFFWDAGNRTGTPDGYDSNKGYYREFKFSDFNYTGGGYNDTIHIWGCNASHPWFDSATSSLLPITLRTYGECTVGQQKCEGGNFYSCNSYEQWQYAYSCPSGWCSSPTSCGTGAAPVTPISNQTCLSFNYSVYGVCPIYTSPVICLTGESAFMSFFLTPLFFLLLFAMGVAFYIGSKLQSHGGVFASIIFLVFILIYSLTCVLPIWLGIVFIILAAFVIAKYATSAVG
jgi:hypothetical protein